MLLSDKHPESDPQTLKISNFTGTKRNKKWVQNMYINQNIDCRCILLWCENTNKELRGNLSSSLPSHTHITSYRTPISQISSERQLISIYCGLDTPLLLRPNQSYSLIPVNLIVKCQGPAENQCCASVHRELSR